MRYILTVLVLMTMLFLAGCRDVDENKPLDSVRNEALKMDAKELTAVVKDYRDAIVTKRYELSERVTKLHGMPVNRLKSSAGRAVKADISKLSRSVDALRRRYDIYSEHLRDKGASLQGLGL